MAHEEELIGMGRCDVPAGRLRGSAGVERGDGELAAALRDAIAEQGVDGRAPSEGWVELLVEEDRAVFGVMDADGAGWNVLVLQMSPAGWRFGGMDHVRPGETRTQRGAGMRLTWGRPAFVAHEGEEPDLELLLHNDREEPWVYEGTCDAFVSVVSDETGVGINESGWTSYAPRHAMHVVPPGGAVAVHVILALAVNQSIPAGRYTLVADVHEHGLRTGESARLEVRAAPDGPGGRPFPRRDEPSEAAAADVVGVVDGPQEWARRCISRELDEEVDSHDDGTQLIPCALRLGPEDAPERMIDVAGAFDPSWAHTWNSGPGREAIRLPDVDGTWLVETGPEADADKLVRRLPELLRRAARQGALHLDDTDTQSDLVDACHTSGVHAVHRIRDDGPGLAHLLTPGTGGEADRSGADVPQWVGRFLRDPAQSGVLVALELNPAPHREVSSGSPSRAPRGAWSPT